MGSKDSVLNTVISPTDEGARIDLRFLGGTVLGLTMFKTVLNTVYLRQLKVLGLTSDGK